MNCLGITMLMLAGVEGCDRGWTFWRALLACRGCGVVSAAHATNISAGMNQSSLEHEWLNINQFFVEESRHEV
jgi:hypothetical protein